MKIRMSEERKKKEDRWKNLAHSRFMKRWRIVDEKLEWFHSHLLAPLVTLFHSSSSSTSSICLEFKSYTFLTMCLKARNDSHSGVCRLYINLWWSENFISFHFILRLFLFGKLVLLSRLAKTFHRSPKWWHINGIPHSPIPPLFSHLSVSISRSHHQSHVSKLTLLRKI